MSKQVFPACPEQRTDCRFQHKGGGSTMMYSPIQYDRDGKAVGGGANWTTECVSCLSCNKRWRSSMQDLQKAQGKQPEWELVK